MALRGRRSSSPGPRRRSESKAVEGSWVAQSGRLVAEPPTSAIRLAWMLNQLAGALPQSSIEGCGVSASFNRRDPSRLTVHTEAWLLRSILLRTSFVLSGDQTGVKKSAPLTGGVICLSPLPSGRTTHAWDMPQVRSERAGQLVKRSGRRLATTGQRAHPSLAA